MAETQPEFLTIGDVLGILLEDFPEVTISKIRFLESQGLIAPERTTSGYRRFHDSDIELLRVILTEQRENYLPLRVIRDRIASGEIDPSGELSRPEGIERPLLDSTESLVAQHPSQAGPTVTPVRPQPDASGRQRAPQLLPGVVLNRQEFCAMTGLSDVGLADLEAFGIVSSRSAAGPATYGEHEVIIGRAAYTLMQNGIDARHLRSWRTAADREASLIGQIVSPQLRQRDPSSRSAAADRGREIAEAGGRLRSALIDAALRDVLS